MEKVRRPVFAWSEGLRRTFRIPSQVMAQIENIVANGPDFVQENAGFLVDKTKKGKELFSLFYETSCHVAGDATRLDESTASLARTPPTEESQVATWCERTFLRGFACYRTGRESEAKQCWQHAISLAPHHAKSTLSARIAIERAAVSLNRGLLQTASFELEALLHHHGESLDMFSRCRTLALLILAWRGLCRLGDAAKALEERRQLVELIPSPLFSATQARAKAYLLLAAGRYGEALTVIEEILPELQNRHVLHVLIEHLRIRTYLDAGLAREASRALEELKAMAREQKISAAVVASVEDEAQLALMERRFSALEKHIHDGLAEASERSDLASRCRLLTLATEGHILQGQWDEARRALWEAESIAKVQGYVEDLLLATVCRALDARAHHKHAECHAELHHGWLLAQEHEMPHWGAAMRYVDALWNEPQEWLEHCLEFLTHSDAHIAMAFPPPLEEALSSSAFSVSEGGQATRILSEIQCRQFLLQRTAIVFWPPGPALALLRRGPREVVRLDPGLQRDDVIIALIAHPAGLSSEEIHARSSRVPFHALRHGERVRSLVHQARASLKRLGIQVEWDRASGLYRLSSRVPIVEIRPAQTRVRSTGRPTFQQRLEEVRQALMVKEKTPTQQLCENLGMTRQALRPYLKTLLEAGEIRLVRRGPISYYIRQKARTAP